MLFYWASRLGRWVYKGEIVSLQTWQCPIEDVVRIRVRTARSAHFTYDFLPCNNGQLQYDIGLIVVCPD